MEVDFSQWLLSGHCVWTAVDAAPQILIISLETTGLTSFDYITVTLINLLCGLGLVSALTLCGFSPVNPIANLGNCIT